MITIPISQLPDINFENPKIKDHIDGMLIIDTAESLPRISGLKIKLSSATMNYENIRIFAGGDVQGKFICHLHGDNITLHIGGNISGAYFIKLWKESIFTIGHGCTANSLEAWVQAYGSLSIGEDCMIAHNVHIQCGDMHGIFDVENRIQLNEGKPIIKIGSHVWLARGAQILKGIEIGNGAIIGMSSLVIKDVDKYSMVAGIPAKVIKKGVSWGRKETLSEEDMTNIGLDYL